MGERIRQHIRSNVWGMAAMFVALTGTAYAVDGPLPGQNQVGSEDIIDAEVKNQDVAPNAIGTGKIDDGGVRSADILDNNLTAADLATGAVGTEEIQNGAVQSVDVLDSSLHGGDVLDSSLAGRDIFDNTLTGEDVADGSLSGVEIEDESLTGADVDDGSLTGADVQNNSLLGSNIADNSIKGAKIVDGNVFSEHIADSSLTGADVQNSSLTGSDIATGSLTGSDIANTSSIGGAEIDESDLELPFVAIDDTADTGECDGALPKSSVETCVDVSVTLLRPFAKLFIVASGGWVKERGDPAGSRCEIQVNDQIPAEALLFLGERTGFGGGHVGVGNQMGFTLNAVTDGLDAGIHAVELKCRDDSDDEKQNTGVFNTHMSVLTVG